MSNAITITQGIQAANVIITGIGFGNGGVLTGSYYPLTSNPSGYITTGQTGSFGNATGNFYLASNPSGFITGFNSGLYVLNSQTGIFITTGQTGSFGGGTTPTGNLTGAFYPLIGNPSGFLTGFNSGIYTLNSNTGNFITTGQTGNFGSVANTGQLTGVFYPLNTNPSGYISGFNSGLYTLNSSTGAFITTGQTGSFGGITPTGILTGVFYPLNTNPSGYISGFNSGLYTLNSSTGAFITTGQTGSFGSVANTGQLTGVFYPYSLNPKGYLTSISGSVNIPSHSFNLNIDWSSGNIFTTTLTGNVNFTFSNQQDGQTIVVSVSNTGNQDYYCFFPSGSGSNSGVYWPNNASPIQTSGNFTDIYTFIDFTGRIYGQAVQGYWNL
jgi:hypothetical protein